MGKQKDKKKKRNLGKLVPPAGVTFSLCMIVKNEAHQLGDCLAPVLPLLDEIIVVDTGSTDNTQEVARQMGARVFEFPWAQDFSAARNESLRQATGQYILWLDADDRIDPGEMAKLRELKASIRPYRPKAYYLLIESTSPLDGESSFYQLRLFPNKPGVRFEGRIHEQVNFSLQRLSISFENLSIRIRHTGYEALSAVKGKYERNWSILEEDLIRDPENLILRYYAARTLDGMNRHQEAITHIKKITDNPTIQKKEKTFYLQSAILLGKYYLNTQNFPEAQELFKKLIQEFPENAIVHYGLGESFYLAGDYDRACSPLRQSLGLPLEVSIFPVNMEKFVYDQYYTLGRCYQRLGKAEEAQGVWKAYIDRNPDHVQTLELLGMLALESNQIPKAAGYLQEAIRKGAASDKIFANLGLCFRKMEQWPEAEQALRQALALNPERLEALINMGILFYRREQYPLALNYFYQALALDHQLVDVLLFLSDSLARLGEMEGLVKACDGLLEILDLDRDLTLHSIQDLGQLFLQIAGTLEQNGKPAWSLQALHLGFSLSPTPESLERIVAKAKEMGNLEATLQRLERDLTIINNFSPHTPDPQSAQTNIL
jgi:tetratricopeptide (TPR) repeat protein